MAKVNPMTGEIVSSREEYEALKEMKRNRINPKYSNEWSVRRRYEQDNSSEGDCCCNPDKEIEKPKEREVELCLCTKHLWS